MLKLKVLKMEHKHIEDVILVENQSFKVPWSRSSFIGELSNTETARYLVAELDGRIIGYGGYWKIFDEGHITNIAILPDFRGKGYGSILLGELINLAKSEGIFSLTLEVRVSNKPAQALYSKFGFLGVGNRKSYYSDNNEDALIMWKYDV